MKDPMVIQLIQTSAALLFVLGLVLLLAWGLRRYLGTVMVRRRTGQPRRLQVVETAVLDARTKLLLVQRDDREHLLLLGPSSAVVVENGIPVATGAENENESGESDAVNRSETIADQTVTKSR